MDAVIVRPPLYEEPRAAAQSRDAPIPTSRKKQSRDQRTSVDDQRDRIICRCPSHRCIDSRPIVGGRAARVLVVSVFQIAVESATDL